MESFFALVYPKSRITSSISNQLENDDDYRQYLLSQGLDPDTDAPDAGEDEIPQGFRDAGDQWVDRESEPAIVFAIQIANPYEESVPLHDIRIRIGDNNRPDADVVE